ncbi:oxidoreductase [Myxococcus sp. K15C18031901]|uniref:oxidoreductase n=1 Tax=Myxococcus dinghuensis TaxID=2906761 RepID=UPI0020A75E6E|nr:oxidoreductase [Myxococcus dinghuensis]MCP3102035.1 oxidoreductase [Myxococcus dinghuensis]
MSKVWFITGSSRGLGRDLTQAALDAGHRVVATARNPEQLEDLAKRYGDRMRAVALDVTDPAAARSAVAAAVSAFGRIDVLVNNAGYANVAAIEDADMDDFRKQFETNYFGVLNVTRAALPVLRKQREGHIIQVSSIGGRMGTPGIASYQSAKWAVEGLSEVLAAEVAPLGIRVTIIEPGGMRTDWAGASMSISDVQDDYQATVGEVTRRLRKSGDAARGDPAKAAQAILRITQEKNPPLRLLLGSDAVFFAEAVANKRKAEDEHWRSLSVSTDYDGQVDFAQTPIAQMLVSPRN